MARTRTTRGVLAIEVGIDVSSPPRALELVVSIPGREGTFTRRWQLSEGLLSDPTYQDLLLWIDRCVVSAVQPYGGVAGILFGDRVDPETESIVGAASD